MVELVDEAHVTVAQGALMVVALAGKGLIAEAHAALAGPVQAGQQVQQGGLAGAGGTDDGQALALFQLQINALED